MRRPETLRRRSFIGNGRGFSHPEIGKSLSIQICIFLHHCLTSAILNPIQFHVEVNPLGFLVIRAEIHIEVVVHSESD